VKKIGFDWCAEWLPGERWYAVSIPGRVWCETILNQHGLQVIHPLFSTGCEKDTGVLVGDHCEEAPRALTVEKDGLPILIVQIETIGRDP
jgi:hypothetical protein